jgi:hypothetical protein
MAFKDKYYDSIHDYLPEDAKQILAAQIPRIREAITQDVEQFGQELGREVQREIDATIKAATDANKASFDALKAQLIGLVAKDSTSLQNAVQQLSASLDDYEKRWRGVGESLQKVALGVVKSAGLPIST